MRVRFAGWGGGAGGGSYGERELGGGYPSRGELVRATRRGGVGERSEPGVGIERGRRFGFGVGGVGFGSEGCGGAAVFEGEPEVRGAGGV